MHVKVTSRSEAQLGERDYRDAVEIIVDGNVVLRFSDGEPEDGNLSRDFSDVHSIPALMRRCHAAGVRGEPLDVEFADDGDY